MKTIMETKHSKGQWVKGTNTSSKDWMKIFCNGKLIADVKELSKKGQRKATDFEAFEICNIRYLP